ncbi:GNAT family N-acetyltransferase [Actinobaculum sp. 313]|uniref:GNAT family N-acetyltransferase n=1 Tax=Actinobaculum sp. 313 TaxID=2495645 RepID=UPI000D526FAA|nr:GNAT family N-acetyltransferase [Actinobaculum sp. 313]AWE43181.1 hypothetical protein DDD63_10990 [Actinobaculum sp. 313]
MLVREITAAEVATWAPRAVDHMTRIREASGALRCEVAELFSARILKTFRVGVPRGSRIFVNDNCTQWLWVKERPKLAVVDAKIDADPRGQWRETLRTVLDGREAEVSFYPGDRSAAALFDGVPYREVLRHMSVSLPRLGFVPAEGAEAIHLRTMGAGELGTFLDAVCESLGRHEANVNPGSDARELAAKNLAECERLLSDGVSTPGHEVCAICTDTRTIGGIWAEIDGHCAFLWNLYVYRPYRGHGHSRAALVALAERLKVEGVRHINLRVVADNFAAQAIYDSVGFALTERTVMLEPARMNVDDAGSSGSVAVPGDVAVG